MLSTVDAFIQEVAESFFSSVHIEADVFAYGDTDRFAFQHFLAVFINVVHAAGF
tara:strand:+ start:23084 stop:23245 length:162 start_codon:yes stop_codon:yes gene_type:complete